MNRSFIFIFLLVSYSLPLFGQTTTEGTDFWMGFMENIHDPPGSPAVLQLSFSAKERATVTVEGPLMDYSYTFEVPVGETTKVEMPIDNFMPKSMGVFGMGIHITADVKISVYALNKRVLSADAAVILPTNALGSDYIVFTHTEAFGLESQVLLVASADDTQIEVIPTQGLFNGFPANQPFTVHLNQGETYQLKSVGDLSGTIVRAVSSDENECKNFAVFGGTKMTFVGSCGANADHLFEQMFPTSTWGQEFLYVPYAARTGGDMLKVGAKESGTVVNVEGMNPFFLEAGEVILVSLALTDTRLITANKPISMAQFARSQDCDNQSGDPFMIMLSPMEQRIRDVTFRAFEAFEIEQYYLTLVARNSDLNAITLDGIPIGNRFEIKDENAFAKLEISQGNHTISAPDGVIAYVYGFGNIESFGYSAGVSLANLNLRVEARDPQLGLIDRFTCFNSTLSLNALFELDPAQPPQFTQFDWDFGDGTTAEGVEVEHTFENPGVYEVSLIASDGSGACSTSEIIKKTVNVVESSVTNITGPSSVCPDVTGIVYSAEAVGAEGFQWTVVGGTIQGSATGPAITVNWGGGGPDAKVSLTVVNEVGCASESFDIPVRIDNRLQPDIPQGATSICFSDRFGVTYSTPPTNGSVYEWVITGGNFVGSNQGNTVSVNWGNAAVKSIGFRETNPDISDCSGDSPVLVVNVMPEITETAVVTNVSCANGNDGNISLQVQGGSAPYFFRWSTGLEGEGQNILSDLEAGVYSIIITDAAGCEETREFEVIQPTPLTVSVNLLSVSCYMGRDGEATALVSGGTAPYSFHWNGGNPDSENVLVGQKAGNYSLRVLDANDCEFILSYEIDQPEPLTGTTLDTPSCPGESTGSILVQASGGTAPYYYRWNTSPPQDQQLIEGLPAGEYSVTITDANGCVFTIETAEITERFPTVNVPSAFTPNGDNTNDGFSIISDCRLPVFEMKIYNSWGLMIFHTSSSAELWDGTYKGEQVPSGKYTYHIAYKTVLNGQPIEDTLVGVVSLLR